MSVRRSIALRTFLAGFVLNAVWETAQLPAYEGMDEIPLWGHLIGGSVATLLDALFITGVYLALAWQAGNAEWPRGGFRAGYLLAALAGALTAVLVERLALSNGWWSYTAAMPVVTVLGAGLYPLIQLTVLTPLAIWLGGRRWTRT